MHALLKHHLLVERLGLVLVEIRVLLGQEVRVVALDTSGEAHGSRRPLPSVQLGRVLERATLLNGLQHLCLVQHRNEVSMANVQVERCLAKLPFHLVLLLDGGR